MRSRDLISIARQLRAGLLGKKSSRFQCVVVSAALQGYLSALCDVQTELVTVDFPNVDHTFLRLPDGRILDPTADQFGLEKVYLGEMPERYTAWIEEAKKEPA